MAEAQGTEFETEIRAAIAPALTEINTARHEINTLHKELMSQMERGTPANDQKVADLEARMEEAERRFAESDQAARATVREMQPEPEKRDVDPFAGVLLANAGELRRAYHTGGREALHRALTSGTTLSSAGSLNADQEQQFLDWLVEQQVALSRVNIRRMVANSAYLDELVTGTRKLRAGTEATAPTVADAFTVARRELSTVETVWGEDLSYSFIEDNIERGNIESHIAQNLARAFGNDHNDLFWNGDDDNSDDFLGINDGIITIAKADASVQDVDASSLSKWTEIFHDALLEMPFAYQARADHAFFIPFNGTHYYADELATRATSLGDQVLVSGQTALRYFGIPVIGEPHLQADEAVLTPLANLIWGVQRGITFESERNPRKRAVEYTISARTDQNYSKSAAVVLVDGIPSTLR